LKKYGVNELRQLFLDFFEQKEHLIMKSFSLVPHNDNSLLIINSGMAPLKPYFTGQEIPPRNRVATCQKCIRTGDIENVGKTARHGTFFEMLGNFSFGDYFKREAIAWSWEFLTEVVGLEADKLYPSVYKDDDEAFDIWNKEMNIPADRIYRMGKEDNFWEHGAGPCGPCSEIYYDRGEKYGTGPDAYVGGESDRFMEIWNNVFTQFDNDGNNNYTELVQKNIDTGMGLERLAVAVQDVYSIFEVDTIKALLDKVSELARTEYKTDEIKDISLRLITDHIRSVTFMISDGIMPSNEGRGYVLRRLLRRAARHGRLLGIEGVFLAELCNVVIDTSKDGYPELNEKKEMIFKVISEEEYKFNKTIDQGLSILNDMIAELETNGNKKLSGEDAFKLYDTYGFPIDLTKEILEEKEILVDELSFNKAMQAQKEKARAARKVSNYMGADVTVYQSIDAAITSEFVGYDKLVTKSKILILTTEDDIVPVLSDGQTGTVIADKTPFYAAMGGQEGDIGFLYAKGGVFEVKETINLSGGKIGHIGAVTEGMICVDETVSFEVNADNRNKICKNHSATHLLQKALKTVLGNHVEQAGSFVSAGRLRFDFTHFSAMTDEEIKSVETLVNNEIANALSVCTNMMNIEEAKKTGAMALFGEKYGETVRVVSMGDFSTELCGGTHVNNTSEITSFKILSEAGIAAGVRRIEALTAEGLLSYYEEIEREYLEVARLLKTRTANVNEKVGSLLAEIKLLNSENEKLKSKLANDSIGDVMNNIKDIKGIKFLPLKVHGVDMNELRNLGDSLKDKIGDGVILIASSTDDNKVNLMATATDNAIKLGAHAGNLIKEVAGLVGGGGGGRPNMAQAGGKNPEGIEQVLETAAKVLESQIK